MGKKFDLGFLDEDESVKILNVLENDFQLRMRERERLGKLRKDINKDDNLALVLSNQKDFNKNCCIRCYKAFFLLFNPKFICFACKFNVCKSCCDFFFQFRSFVCVTCQKEKDIMAQSCDWFYETVQRKFRQCGSVKVARTLSTSGKSYRALSTQQKITCLLDLMQRLDASRVVNDFENGRGGRTRPSILEAFSGKKQDDETNSENSSNGYKKTVEDYCIAEDADKGMTESDESHPEMYKEPQVRTTDCREDEIEDVKLRKMREFEEAFPEARLRPTDAEENSQKGVLRRMKAMQMARFHEQVHEVMTRIRAEVSEKFPNHLPSPRRNPQFRQFVRKAREELTVVLKNFSQILAITIESHNLAIGRTSEDVQMDIQYILQDEVEAIVSRRIDVSFDDTTSLYTDEGSKLSNPGAVEQRLAAITLKKIFDDYRVSLNSPYGPEEAAALRELDQLIDEADCREYPSIGSRRNHDGDADYLSVSDIGIRHNRTISDSGQISQSGSVHSAGSSSQWLLRGKPSAVSASSMSGLGKDSVPKVGGKAPDELSDLSGGSEEQQDDEVSEYQNDSDYNSNIWAGTTSEEKKKEVLQHLRQQDSGINVQYDFSPPSSAGLSDTAHRRGHPRMQHRIDNLSRDVIVANQKTTGAASAVENTAEQMENIYDQLSVLNRQVNKLSAELTPAKALRQTSTVGVNTAAQALQHVRNKPYPFPIGDTLPPPEVEQKEVEEDIYIKAAEMADLIALIEDLEGTLLKDSKHTHGNECSHHLQHWSSIEGHVVSTVERLDGDLRDVDNIGARVTSLTARGTRQRALDSNDVTPRRTNMGGQGVRRSSSDVNFGDAAQRYDPWLRGETSRDAWEEYRQSTKRF